ncbi:hypothetical protein G4B88_022886 [Cannabis sativa]|uniref:CRC domain-containing protein n=1 Tax=Cannabis sativa TaxID=3483 RepID=A0A7J6HWZ9_CANSA|nr:hypothetical protein G4B88_022886 [Cannabis sativa]
MNPPYESTENKNEDPNNEPSNNLMMMSTMPAQTNQVEINLYEEKSSEKKRHERQRLLHLYCDCFLNGNYCGNFCTCDTCKNKIETHNEVEGALKKFKARNPHAFDSKMENGDSTPTPAPIPAPAPTPTTSSGPIIYEMENGFIGVSYPNGPAPGPTTSNSILSNHFKK